MFFTAVLFFGAGHLRSQVVFENNSMVVTKGFVKANHNEFKKCSFDIEAKDGASIELLTVMVNGVRADVIKMKTGPSDHFVVSIPEELTIPLDQNFIVRIEVDENKAVMSNPFKIFSGNTALSALTSLTGLSAAKKSFGGDINIVAAGAGGPGGPGGGGDPTVIIIKYP